MKPYEEMTPEEVLGIKQPATEETLQSIDSTLKRIETILLHNQEQRIQSCALDVPALSQQK